MCTSIRVLCAASIAALAFPFTVVAQDDIEVRTAGVELGVAALEFHIAANESLAGTRRGEILVRDLQNLRTQIDLFRAGVDGGRPPLEVARRYARVDQAHRLVRRDVQGMNDLLGPSLAAKARRLERAFLTLDNLMRSY